MKINSFYPVIATKELEQSATFYQQYFGFKPSFSSDWYISLVTQTGFELAILDYEHESVPKAFRQPTQGLLLNFEVENVDQKYAEISQAGLPLHLDIRSEDWGQRHFITADPNSILIDVIQNIEPSKEFKQMYSEGHLVGN